MKKLFIGLLFTAISSVSLFTNSKPDGFLHVYLLNIGQGDAILIRTPSGKNILVDGGPGQTVLKELKDTLPFFDRSLDLVISTHPDKDHIEGLIAVLQQQEVRQVFANGIMKSDYLSQSFFKAIHEKNIPVTYVSPSSDLDFGDGVALDVISPLVPQFSEEEKTNNFSIVSKVVYGEHEILLTGDIEMEAEEALVASNADIDADILKVAHHGSKTSSTDLFLAAVMPETCVISVGRKNNYHHPHPTVLARLQKHCKKILRTDILGRIEMIFDEEKLIGIKT